MNNLIFTWFLISQVLVSGTKKIQGQRKFEKPSCFTWYILKTLNLSFNALSLINIEFVITMINTRYIMEAYNWIHHIITITIIIYVIISCLWPVFFCEHLKCFCCNKREIILTQIHLNNFELQEEIVITSYLNGFQCKYITSFLAFF